MGLGDLLRQHVAQRLAQRSPAQGYEAAARAQAQAQALQAGAAQPGVSPLAALRNAQRSAAQASVGAGMEAARMRAAEQSQLMPLAAQLAAQDQQRGDRFLGAGISAGASGLGALLSVFGGGGQQGGAPGTTSGIPGAQMMGPQPMQQQAPAVGRHPPQAVAPQMQAPQQSGGLSSLVPAAGSIAGTAAGGPVGGVLGGMVGNALPVPVPEGGTGNPLEDLLRAMGGYG